MKQSIHVETPDGEIVDDHSKKLEDLKTGKDKQGGNDAADNAAGPKSNPDPRANANLPLNEQHPKAAGTNDVGTGTEVTDGEGG